MKTFGALLKEFREKAGLSQYELSDIVKIHPSHISRLERGERKPRLKNVIRFINSLNLKKEDGKKLISAAGYSKRIHESLVFFSPYGIEDIELEELERKEISELKNPALKLVAEILSDPELTVESRKEIEKMIISFGEWLRNKKKDEIYKKFTERKE